IGFPAFTGQGDRERFAGDRTGEGGDRSVMGRPVMVLGQESTVVCGPPEARSSSTYGSVPPRRFKMAAAALALLRHAMSVRSTIQKKAACPQSLRQYTPNLWYMGN